MKKQMPTDTLMKMKIKEKGMQAVTHYEVVNIFKGYSLVRVTIETGRTHQIRVHMSSIGYPLLGDALYGADIFMKRTALHAAGCSFLQPFTKEKICLKAEIPEDMKSMIT